MMAALSFGALRGFPARSLRDVLNGLGDRSPGGLLPVRKPRIKSASNNARIFSLSVSHVASILYDVSGEAEISHARWGQVILV